METMDTMTKDWFDAVGSGNIQQIQQLIQDKMPVDIITEVILTFYIYIYSIYFYIGLCIAAFC